MHLNIHSLLTEAWRQVALITAMMLGLLAGQPAGANNIAVSKVAWTPRPVGQYVRFNIQWENSWRNDIGNQAAPCNYDAAWVFVKWRTNDTANGVTSDWSHASLSTNAVDHVAPDGCALTVGRNGRAGDWGSKGLGVFIYRDANGSGLFTATNVLLQWPYEQDGVTDHAPVEVKVCAIEMVYVPTGAFYVGGGTWENHFHDSTNTASPFLMTNETCKVPIGMNSPPDPGYLYYVSNSVHCGDQTGVLASTYPKGVNAFYTMKYGITQAQYVDFLNTIKREQQYFNATYNHMYADVGEFLYGTSGRMTPAYRNGVQLIADPGEPVPRVFANNLNTGNTPNAADDGQWIACNYIRWADVTAYLDWAGLRPMTELEYEKACRGTNMPVAIEWAYGSTLPVIATNILNAGTAYESPLPPNANSVTDNKPQVQGPMRVGCMGIGGNGSRWSAGASYYGIMELSANLWERTVTVGRPTGRAFTGQHGDGALDLYGNANVDFWPGWFGDGGGMRGGRWFQGMSWAGVACRLTAAEKYFGRAHSLGGRGVRSAP